MENLSNDNPNPKFMKDLEGLTMGIGEDGSFNLKAAGSIVQNLFESKKDSEAPAKHLPVPPKVSKAIEKQVAMVQVQGTPEDFKAEVSVFTSGSSNNDYLSVNGHQRYEVSFKLQQGDEAVEDTFFSNHPCGQRLAHLLIHGAQATVTDHLWGRVYKITVV